MSAQSRATWRRPRVGGRKTGELTGRSIEAACRPTTSPRSLRRPAPPPAPAFSRPPRACARWPRGARGLPDPEGAAELGEAALEARLAEVHGDVSSERHALVAVLREKLVGAQVEVVTDGP